MSSRCAAIIGAVSWAIAWSPGVVSALVRLPNTALTRASSSPERSSATMVFSNVGAWREATIALTSAVWRAIASRYAGRKCASRIWSNGGTPNGVVHSASNGLAIAVSAAADWAVAGRATNRDRSAIGIESRRRIGATSTDGCGGGRAGPSPVRTHAHATVAGRAAGRPLGTARLGRARSEGERARRLSAPQRPPCGRSARAAAGARAARRPPAPPARPPRG